MNGEALVIGGAICVLDWVKALVKWTVRKRSVAYLGVPDVC